MTKTIVALEDAGFVYANSPCWLFRNICFSLQEGERIGIIGDNGSGKTTLLHLLLGLRPLTNGTLRHRGKPAQEKETLRALRREVGIVFQNCDDQLFSPTVIEDVAFGLLNLGETSDAAAAQARDMLAHLGVAHLEQRLTHTLSGGEKRLVALATTLVMRPQALLLDEPTNDLDERGRQRVADVLAHSAIAMTLVSHDPAFVRRQRLDRMLFLSEGCLKTSVP